MPSLPIYYNVPNFRVPVSVSFSADPASLLLILTDPTGAATTYTYSEGGSDPDSIVKDATGKYHFQYEVTEDSKYGLWNYTWVGDANVSTGSFRMFDMDGAAGRNRTYVGMEELKSSVNDRSAQDKDDYEYQRACITATTLIHDLCGQHFFQVTEPRTFSYESIYELFVDPFVKGTITEFAVDYVGDGSYSSIWTEGTDFQAMRFNQKYNLNWLGEERPQDFIRVLLSGTNTTMGGEMLPFTIAYTPDNRVRINATWGWPQIPENVHHAALLLAVDLFKMKDAPWGIAGMGELGQVRTQANPEVMELLQKYREVRNLVGV